MKTMLNKVGSAVTNKPPPAPATAPPPPRPAEQQQQPAPTSAISAEDLALLRDKLKEFYLRHDAKKVRNLFLCLRNSRAKQVENPADFEKILAAAQRNGLQWLSDGLQRKYGTTVDLYGTSAPASSQPPPQQQQPPPKPKPQQQAPPPPAAAAAGELPIQVMGGGGAGVAEQVCWERSTLY
jgi:hypothetical protein